MIKTNPSSPPSSTYPKNEPFLLAHIALLAGVPLTLVLCMMGLAVGNPVLPGWIETFLLGLPPIALGVWLQWQQPLSPFGLWAAALPDRELSEDRRRVLTLLKQRPNGWYLNGLISAVVGVFLYVVFRQIYLAAPLAESIAPFPPVLRLFGIVWAEVFFLASNLLAQMGVAAMRVLITTKSEFDSLDPYAPERIKSDFTTLGWRSPQLSQVFAVQSAPASLPEITAQVGKPETVVSQPIVSDALKEQLTGLFTSLLEKVSSLFAGQAPVPPIGNSKPPTTPAAEVDNEEEWEEDEADEAESEESDSELADSAASAVVPEVAESKTIEEIPAVPDTQEPIEATEAIASVETGEPDLELAESAEEPVTSETVEMAEFVEPETATETVKTAVTTEVEMLEVSETLDIEEELVADVVPAMQSTSIAITETTESVPATEVVDQATEAVPDTEPEASPDAITEPLETPVEAIDTLPEESPHLGIEAQSESPLTDESAEPFAELEALLNAPATSSPTDSTASTVTSSNPKPTAPSTSSTAAEDDEEWV
jgi:hypothetical protein